jgi:iron complex outermembrane receptor protein
MDILSYGRLLSSDNRPRATLACLVASISAVMSAHAQTRNERALEEVIVTAQKRSENLQEVPVPVTAIDAQSLTESNLLRLKDYYSKVPGLALAQTGDTGQPIIAIRGLITGGQSNTTVGYVIDDVPYGSTINPGTFPYAPDIDPSDMSRIEVLRGPQGTLYGASSLGGLLKFVTVDPSPEQLSGRIETGATSIKGSDDVGYGVRGSINVPLSDDVAIRASAFTREEPGYIDNVVDGKKDINSTSATGGRLSALWRPSDAFSLKLSALVQDIQRDGSDDVNTSTGGELQQSSLPGTGTYDRKSEAYSASMTARLGSVDLVSVTGYTVDDIEMISDVPAFGGLSAFFFGVAGANVIVPLETKKFTQELRATFTLGERTQWLVGAFYTDEDFSIDGYSARAADPQTGALVGTYLTIRQPVTYEEYAAFSTLTFDVTDRFDIQVGGRYSENRQTFSSFRNGPAALFFYGSDPSSVTGVSAEDSSFTYLFTPRYKVSPDLMLYARFASGYRPGGSNANCTTTIPCQYDPDTTKNYDLGIKGNAFEDTLQFDASLYYIDWKDIQIPLFTGGLAFTDNVGAAKSQGVELSIATRPADGLAIGGWVAWNDATLEQAFPPTSFVAGQPGDRLPYGSRFSGSLSIGQKFGLGSATAEVGAALSYVGERRGQFVAAGAPRGTFPSYAQLDLNMGLDLTTWRLNAFVNNVTDKRGVLRDGVDFGNPDLVTYIQPRTLGLQLQYQF